MAGFFKLSPYTTIQTVRSYIYALEHGQEDISKRSVERQSILLIKTCSYVVTIRIRFL